MLPYSFDTPHTYDKEHMKSCFHPLCLIILLWHEAQLHSVGNFKEWKDPKKLGLILIICVNYVDKTFSSSIFKNVTTPAVIISYCHNFCFVWGKLLFVQSLHQDPDASSSHIQSPKENGGQLSSIPSGSNAAWQVDAETSSPNKTCSEILNNTLTM